MKHDTSICPVQKTALLLSDAWTMLILRDVLVSPKRFCELEESLEGISTRTLTLKLKKLTEEGMLVKTDTHAYAATKQAKGLRTIERAMHAYGKKYL